MEYVEWMNNFGVERCDEVIGKFQHNDAWYVVIEYNGWTVLMIDPDQTQTTFDNLIHYRSFDNGL